MEQTKLIYRDLDELLYSPEIIQFFRKMMDDFTLELFKKVVRQNKAGSGLVKTRLEDYHSLRKRYDTAFTVLEAQGFIQRKEDGTSTPYFVTVRGNQLLKLIVHEKDENN